MHSDERRLHPFSLLFALGTGAGRFLLPGLLVLFAARRGEWDQWQMWISILIVPYAVASLLKYLTFRYQFRPDELVIRSGMIFHNERHIPYERIHNIATVRNILHRLLGVADVRLETAGGQEPEARIQVLGMDAVEEMRRRVFSERRMAAAAAGADGAGDASDTVPGAEMEPAGTTLVAMSPWDLALFGLVDNRGGVVVAAALGIFFEMSWQFGFTDRWGFAPTRLLVPFFDRSVDMLPGSGVVAAVLAGLVGLFAVLRVLSMGWAFVNLYGFRLSLVGRDLSCVHGLFTRIATSIPLHRVQVVVVRERPLHRLLGCVEVKVETAGGGSVGEGEQQRKASQQWLAPLLPKERLAAFLSVVEPGLDLDALPWEPVDPRASVRILKREMIGAALIPLALVYYIRWWAIPLFLVLLVSGWLQSRHQPERMGYATPAGFVAWRSGWLWRKISIARASKIQSVAVSESPFDRRYAMAGVTVDTAGAGSSVHRIRIPFLDRARALDLAAALAGRAEATEFRW